MTDQATSIAPPTNALALAGMVLGAIANGYALLVGLFNGAPSPLGLLVLVWLPTFVPGLLAVIFGFVGINTANRLGGRRKALAIWSVVLGFTPLLTWFVAFLLSAALFGS
jgi:hypothetical protein